MLLFSVQMIYRAKTPCGSSAYISTLGWRRLSTQPVATPNVKQAISPICSKHFQELTQRCSTISPHVSYRPSGAGETANCFTSTWPATMITHPCQLGRQPGRPLPGLRPAWQGAWEMKDVTWGLGLKLRDGCKRGDMRVLMGVSCI